MKQVVSIVGMIYKSVTYLNFMLGEIKEYCFSLKENYDVNYLIVANDPTNSVQQKLHLDNIVHVVYKDPKSNDYYMNRVYRAWNFGGRNAPGDILVFINSDMAFSPNWLGNLLKHLTPQTIPCSRLVESGKLRSGQHAVSKNFGRTPKEFRRKDFLDYAKSIKLKQIHPGGLYMPCAFYRKDFIQSGGYPEGNIYAGGEGAFGTKFIESGDFHFFNRNSVMRKKKHITVFDSIVYHIQEGEKDV
jgi:hypothetical protein